MGAAATRAGKQAVRIANGIVNFTVIVLVLLLVAFSLYALWDSDQVHNQASATQYEAYKPTVEDEGESFAQLVAINPEVFSWLTVYGTNIDYPVTQAEDNWKYVNTNAKGEYSLSGSIFLDSANSPDFSDFNSIFYGHHMEKQAMFGDLGLFAGAAYFEERRYGNLYYEGRDHGLEFFAFMHVDAYDTSVFAAAIEGDEMQQAYLDNLLEKSMYTRDIGVTGSDRIVLLTTCSSQSTNGRDILVGRLTDELYDDTFTAQDTGNQGITAGVDEQTGGWWTALPIWAWGGMLAILVLLVLGFVLVNRRKKKRQAERLQMITDKNSRLRTVYRRNPPLGGGDVPENTEDR